MDRQSKRLIEYLAIAIAVILIFVFFSVDKLPHDTQDLIKIICGNLFTAIASFLAISFFLERQNININRSSSQELNFDEETFLQTIDVKLEQFKNDINNKISDIGKPNNEEEKALLQQIDSKLLGLKEPEISNIFQDFNVTRADISQNINAISSMWADTFFKDWIKAEIRNEDGEHFARVFFNSHEGSWGCNLSIRPQNQKPVKLFPNIKFLTLWLRVPEIPKGEVPELTTNEKSILDNVGIAVVVVNGILQHWQYAAAENQFIQTNVQSKNWQRFDIPLDQKSLWSLFNADGNCRFGDTQNPDFLIISSVVIKVGKYNGKRSELSAGKGIIDIKRIEFNV